MRQSNELLFTYGTLRRGVESPMQRYLTDHTTWLGEAVFQGKLYFIGGHPAAIPSSSEEDTIIGDLFEIQTTSDLIQRLDQYEGFNKNNPEVSLYIREKRKVRLKKSNAVHEAWIYIFNGPRERSIEIESGDYLGFREE